jgi:ABC-type branched-subunit amino acid transport system substrate-binding protein
MIVAAALFSAAALLTAACGSEGGGGGTQAADCSAEDLAALGRLPSSNDFKLAANRIATPKLDAVKGDAPRVLAQAKKTVKLGVFGDLTGQNSQLVIHIRNSTIMAVEEANKAAGLPRG